MYYITFVSYSHGYIKSSLIETERVLFPRANRSRLVPACSLILTGAVQVQLPTVYGTANRTSCTTLASVSVETDSCRDWLTCQVERLTARKTVRCSAIANTNSKSQPN